MNGWVDGSTVKQKVGVVRAYIPVCTYIMYVLRMDEYCIQGRCSPCSLLEPRRQVGGVRSTMLLVHASRAWFQRPVLCMDVLDVQDMDV